MASLNQTLISGAGTINIVYGTCLVGQTWGVVRSSNCKDTCDEQLFTDCRENTREVLLKNERVELTMQFEYDPELGIPSRGDDISFPEPFEGLTGQVTEIGVTYDRGDKVLVEITAKHWKSLGNSPTVTTLNDA